MSSNSNPPARIDPVKEFQGEFRFLSNFWPARVKLGDLWFPSVEHAYQAAKTNSIVKRQQFQVGSPGNAKRMGRKVDLRPDWEHVKLAVMEELLRQKFSPETELAKKLSDTHPRELIEGNKWGDTFWGMCFGRGFNHLGRLLMEIRNTLLE